MLQRTTLLLLLAAAPALAQGPADSFEASDDIFSQPADCNRLMQDAGQLFSVSEAIQETANQLAYYQEFEAFHQRRGTKGWMVSTPDAIKTLESEFGPPITFTTFSRELTSEEHYLVAEQVLGVLSNLPQKGAIITSGGTMGERGDPHSIGGGVGITQKTSMQLGFKTLSVTASKAFKYRAAHADYLCVTPGGFSSESRTMYELSKALIVIGGGGQAYVEALEYLQFNPKGILVLIDAAGIEGSSRKLMSDLRFVELAAKHPNIIIAKNGSEAAIELTDRLGLRIGDHKNTTLEAAAKGVNRLSHNADLHVLLPKSRIIGFSGWSNFDLAGPDAVPVAKEISTRVEAAMKRIHQAFLSSDRALLYATAGNDPKLGNTGVPAFETYAHELDLPVRRGKHIALTVAQMPIAELNSKISAYSVVAPTWGQRTFQLAARVDLLVTSGGNQTVIEQSIQAAHLKRPQLHISGANTLTDLRIEQLKAKNPNLVVLTPEQIAAKSDAELLSLTGISPPAR